uniref:Uncharacterized protein n=1 Tax=Candidatus Methanogaster sp. ANME-2c ERB4 TaxID=2759911 RepID=A0A7G9YHH6_9EURY|nr:hypothetical protein IILFPGFB_00033 [Methanosarcinales archaeon ANME-2c ERB4]
MNYDCGTIENSSENTLMAMPIPVKSPCLWILTQASTAEPLPPSAQMVTVPKLCALSGDKSLDFQTVSTMTHSFTIAFLGQTSMHVPHWVHFS